MNNIRNIIIGIDFSRLSFNACLLVERKVAGESEFANDVKGYRELVKWVKVTSGQGKRLNPASVLFCGEHTGTCSVPLSDYLYAKGYSIWPENALRIKRSGDLNRVKTDKADAKMIATYACKNYEEDTTRLYAPLSEDLRKLSALYQYRHQVVNERVAIINRLSSGAFKASATATRLMNLQIKQLGEIEKKLREDIAALLKTSEELSNNYKILISFKGIGPITAALLLIYTANFTRFEEARQFSCFCGIAPFGEQSGTPINKRPHVNFYAHKELKAALVQACEAAIRYNPVIREYALRLDMKGKHYGVIMNNVKNKMIHILFKMIQTNSFLDPEYRQNHEPASRKETIANQSECEHKEVSLGLNVALAAETSSILDTTHNSNTPRNGYRARLKYKSGFG